MKFCWFSSVNLMTALLVEHLLVLFVGLSQTVRVSGSYSSITALWVCVHTCARVCVCSSCSAWCLRLRWWLYVSDKRSRVAKQIRKEIIKVRRQLALEKGGRPLHSCMDDSQSDGMSEFSAKLQDTIYSV